MKKSNIFALGAALLCVVGSWWLSPMLSSFYQNSNSSNGHVESLDSGPGAKAAAPDGGDGEGASEGSDAGQEMRSSPNQAAAEPSWPAPLNPFSGLHASRRDLTGGDVPFDPFGGETEEDKAWLDRNGYPNALLWDALTKATDMELDQAVLAGDKIAEVFRDAKRLGKGEPDALATLLDHWEGGSQFALAIATSHLAGNGQASDPRMAYVLFRLMEMSGNYSAAMSREMTVGAEFDQLQRLEAEAMALALFASRTSPAFASGTACVLDIRPITVQPDGG